MNLLIIIIGLMILAGISKACADNVQSQIDHSIFKGNSFFDASLSWRNKWAKGFLINNASYYHWYYLGYATKYKERFPFSSTILVFVTDGWHLCNFITYTCYEWSIVRIILGPILGNKFHVLHYCLFFIIGIILLKSFRGIGFNLFYNKILLKK